MRCELHFTIVAKLTLLNNFLVPLDLVNCNYLRCVALIAAASHLGTSSFTICDTCLLFCVYHI